MECYFRNPKCNDAPYVTIPNRLKTLAIQTPDKTGYVFRSALDDSRMCITYGELFRKSESFGKGLISIGVKKGDVVAFVDDGTPESLFAIFGVQMAGAVPLLYRLSRKDGMDVVNMMENTKCSIMIADPGHMDENWDVLQKFIQKTEKDGTVVSQEMPSLQTLILTKSPSTSDNLLTVQGVMELTADADCDLPEMDPDDIAVMFSTSGSTGPPKSVPHSHYSLLLCGYYFDVAYGSIGNNESVLFNDRPFIWIGGFPCWELVNGGSRVLIRNISKIKTSSEAIKLIARVVRTEHCTCALFITPFLSEMIAKESFELDLDTIVAGGQPLQASFSSCVGKLCKNYTLLYGSTEVGMVSCKRVSDHTEEFENYLLGEPLPGVELKIVNGDGKRCQIGETGELWVRSPIRFAGYAHQEKASKEAITEAGWFKTSDLCHVSNKGNIIFDGRASEAMILFGKTIHPSQLESEIKRHPAVHDVVVSSVSGEKLFAVAVAAVVLETGFSATGEDLTKFLSDLKKNTERAVYEPLRQEYLPKHYIFFDHFKRTFNGKIDRKGVADEIKRMFNESERK